MVKVLLADDDRSVRLLIRRMLTSLRCEVVEAENGVAALEKLSTMPFSLAILDLGMPLLNGLEVLQAIRKSPDHGSLPVIVVSGAADHPTALDIVGLGVTDFLAKPFRVEQFKTRLAAAIQGLDPTNIAMPADARPPMPAVLPEGVRPVLLVDSNAEFRKFVASVLTPRYSVLEVDSGQNAVSVCISHRPLAVVIGPEIGMFSPPLLASKLRASPQIDGTRLVLAARADQLESLGDTSIFDAIIDRSFVPDELRGQFERATELAAVAA